MKHSILLRGRKTSITLEAEFWRAFRDIAAERGIPAQSLVEEVAKTRTNYNLSSHIRVYVLEHIQARVPKPKRRTEA